MTPIAGGAAAAVPPVQGADHSRVGTDRDRVSEPDRMLGADWRTSTDRAVTGSGDETGFHLLVADEKDAYRWRTVATLVEPRWQTDHWIGQFCVTGSGRRAVVVYAPRQFTNREDLMDRGGYAAVVDLSTGAVTRLGTGASLAYYNPACGVDETAVVSRLEFDRGTARTWLGVVDAAGGRMARRAWATGQVTSPVPYRGEVVAARGASLVAFDTAGRERRLTGAPGTPFRIYPDLEAGLAFQTIDASSVRFHRYAGGKVTDVGSAPSGTLKLRPGAGGRVFLTGYRAGERLRQPMPGGWRTIDTAPDSDISTTGALAVSRVDTHVTGGAMTPNDGAPAQVRIDARTGTGSAVAFEVLPEAATRQQPPAGPPAGTNRIPPYDYSTVPYEPDRLCAGPRNDPAVQVYQPSFKQVEWAADLAVRGMLTFQRPANWSNNGLPAYSPQGLFPSLTLAGVGGTVPEQVLLGILAQESNLWQASWHAVDGSAGNPLTSAGYYGLDLEAPSVMDITWHDANPKVDCGYGAAQVTTGMLLADRGQVVDGLTITKLHQDAVTLDYATNIAAGLRILQGKWNETRNAGLIANNGDPRFIENWWFALWAYNTGFWRYEDRGQHNGSWGVGWSNNPANPKYPADRQLFLKAPLDVPSQGIDDNIGYDNAKHPNHWSYPERVIGWAYTSLIKIDYAAHDFAPTYLTARAGADMWAAQPGRFAFCTPAAIDGGGNECAPGTENPNNLGDPYGPCTRPDLTCWWHYPKTWIDCSAYCGTGASRFTSVEPRPLVDSVYPSQCSVAGLPAGARIIDDITVTQKAGPGGCTPNWTRGGTFSLKFGEYVRNGYTIYPSKVDFHQIGAGFGGHFWFAHTMKPVDVSLPNDYRKVTGTWTVDPTTAWTRVFVHVPDHGAHTRQADYKVYLPGQSTSTQHRTIPTRWEQNKWIDIGVFDFTGAGNPRIELSNFAGDGRYVEDVAWDAIAVQPLGAKPKHFVVALGDSYSSGEGAGTYSRVSDQYAEDPARRNACRRGVNGWARLIALPGSPGRFGDLKDVLYPTIDFQSVACVGATTRNLRTAGGGQPSGSWGEVNQVDSGFLDGNTTLVTLTIGGNDAGWSNLLRVCAMEENCPAVRSEGGRTLADVTRDRIRNEVRRNVQLSIAEIRTRAPNALIALAGYPLLIAPGSSLSVPIVWPPGTVNVVTVGFDPNEVAFMNEMANLLATEVLGSVGAGVVPVDVRSEFAGHELLGVGFPYYLNTLVPGDLIEDEDGEPVQVLGMESCHPNAYGAAAYGRAVTTALNNRYVW
ncbi:SGNH/GDSL hydrolase family protein [Virgisporangium aurantiacum]|uniref:SGNH/GDSL hydrolase family protein n=1 Tax=Virgisporangium aurantiacum TaxID=175570 RepID=UPI0019500B09|nr:SGNH/GDSL hydrolase family protein [Virgisporangium aurantiacum]